MAVVRDVIAIMDQMAPARLAQEWDNSGLQCGNPDWQVKHVMVSLDPSPDVVRAACKKNADMLITHHPLIFRPLKNLVLDTSLGKILDSSIRHRLAIFSAHTNLDSACGGLNDFFAEKIGLHNLSVLEGETEERIVKLVVYVPSESFEDVFQAILETDAGVIGNYTGCTFRQEGIGTFIPGKGARPKIGSVNTPEAVNEFRIETRVRKNRIAGVLAHIRRSHPYETMAYDIYPLFPEQTGHGIGRIGELAKSTALTSLADKIKATFGLSALRVCGAPDMMIKKVAVCTGSGGGLLKRFFSTDADVYISGDLKFHDARNAEINHRALIDIGHFVSEAIMIDLVAGRLNSLMREKGLDIRVEPFKEERDPFQYI